MIDLMLIEPIYLILMVAVFISGVLCGWLLRGVE